MKKIQYLLGISMVLHSYVHAQTSNNIVTTAVPFLRISTDAKASGMAATGIATTPDISAVYYNIGKLPFSSEKSVVNANYSPWLKSWSSDMYLASAGGYYKLNENEAIHGLIRYFNPGDLQFSDNNGNHLQSYHPNEFAVDMGYSRKLSDRIGLGIGIKYIRSDLARGTQNGQSYKAGNAVAADIGLYYNLRKENESGWSFGAQLSNLGSKISYSENQKAFIPANLGLGASYSKAFDEQNKLVLAVDMNKLLVPTSPADSAGAVAYSNKSVVGSWGSSFSDAALKTVQISVGAEYWYNNQFAIRAGYFYEDKSNGDRKYFSAGASIRYNVFTANFSYLAATANSSIKNPLSNTLLFGIAIALK